MDPTQQIIDDGAVIGYRPDLRYEIEKTRQDTKQTEASEGNLRDIGYHSKSFITFATNTPAKTVNNLTNSIANLSNLVDRLASAFASEEWNDYNDISSLINAYKEGDEKYAEEFVNHYKNGYKSVIPEVIQEIIRAQQRMEAVMNTIATIYYGDNGLTYEEMAQIDSDKLVKLASYESNGDLSKINYVAIANDGILNRGTYDYAINVNANAIKLTDMVLEEKTEKTSTISKIDVIKELIKEANDEIIYIESSYNKHHSSDVMTKALYNYYNKRTALLDLYNLNAEVNADIILRKIAVAKQEVDEALTDVYRTYIACWNHLDNILKYEKEKKELIEIYKSVFT